MENYQIKLTPVDTFFFGGEKHDEDLKTNYFVESNNYPQQTTLLGLLRYYLLVKGKLLNANGKIADHAKASDTIGGSSFNYNNVVNSFGKIITLSPLYFCNGEDSYFFGPMDVKFDMQELQLSMNGTKYKTKDHFKYLDQYLINSNGDTKKISDLIKDDNQVGNEKAEKGESRDNKYYKQVSKKLASGWSFCFDTEIESGSNISDGEILYMPFGGEKSYFKVETFKKDKTSFELSNRYVRNEKVALCISDCFADGEILKNCSFAINDFVSFRSLQSSVKHTQKYNSLSSTDGTQLNRSLRYNLLKRGSVLYFENSEDLLSFKTEIEKKQGFNIGFNHIIIKN